MLNRLTQSILRNASPGLALLLFVAMVPFIFVFFPMRHSRLGSYAGYPLRVFDTRLFYTPSQVSELASAIGESGRQLYALTEVSLDFVFPLLYTNWLSVLLALVVPKAWPARPGVERLIAAVPGFAGRPGGKHLPGFADVDLSAHSTLAGGTLSSTSRPASQMVS